MATQGRKVKFLFTASMNKVNLDFTLDASGGLPTQFRTAINRSLNPSLFRHKTD